MSLGFWRVKDVTLASEVVMGGFDPTEHDSSVQHSSANFFYFLLSSHHIITLLRANEPHTFDRSPLPCRKKLPLSIPLYISTLDLASLYEIYI